MVKTSVSSRLSIGLFAQKVNPDSRGQILPAPSRVSWYPGVTRLSAISHPGVTMPAPLAEGHFNEDVARHMRRDFAPLLAGQTVGEALARLREQPPAGRV